MALKATEMAEAMEKALKEEWQSVKKVPLPGAGLEDRRLLFAGIARGILEYLDAHQNEVMKSITMQDSSGHRHTYEVIDIDLNIIAGA